MALATGFAEMRQTWKIGRRQWSFRIPASSVRSKIFPRIGNV